jgi:hypothetical protein
MLINPKKSNHHFVCDAVQIHDVHEHEYDFVQIPDLTENLRDGQGIVLMFTNIDTIWS